MAVLPLLSFLPIHSLSPPLSIFPVRQNLPFNKGNGEELDLFMGVRGILRFKSSKSGGICLSFRLTFDVA